MTKSNELPTNPLPLKKFTQDRAKGTLTAMASDFGALREKSYKIPVFHFCLFEIAFGIPRITDRKFCFRYQQRVFIAVDQSCQFKARFGISCLGYGFHRAVI